MAWHVRAVVMCCHAVKVRLSPSCCIVFGGLDMQLPSRKCHLHHRTGVLFYLKLSLAVHALLCSMLASCWLLLLLPPCSASSASAAAKSAVRRSIQHCFQNNCSIAGQTGSSVPSAAPVIGVCVPGFTQPLLLQHWLAAVDLQGRLLCSQGHSTASDLNLLLQVVLTALYHERRQLHVFVCMPLPLKSLSCRRVDWQLWTSSSDGCGTSCARQSDFKKAFSTTAQQLQQVRRTAAQSSLLCAALLGGC